MLAGPPCFTFFYFTVKAFTVISILHGGTCTCSRLFSLPSLFLRFSQISVTGAVPVFPFHMGARGLVARICQPCEQSPSWSLLTTVEARLDVPGTQPPLGVRQLLIDLIQPLLLVTIWVHDFT